MATTTTSPNPIPVHYGLLLFPEFEVLDAAGPLEILNTLTHHLHQPPEIHLSVIAQSLDPVSPGGGGGPSHNFTGRQLYLPTHTFETAPRLDVLIVPGGRGTARGDEEVKPLVDFIRERYEGGGLQYLFSICTGSALLAKAGVLDGEKATTNKKAWGRVTPSGPRTHWVAKARWVESGRVWTTSGVSAGIDGMVALVGRVYGEEVAGRVCEFIEYDRVREAGEDPFAEVNGCVDVLPVDDV